MNAADVETGAAPSDEPLPTKKVQRPVVLRHRVQYAALRAVFGAFGTLGFHRASDLGARLGRLAMAAGLRRSVVERQIAACFPHWKPEQVQACALGAYESLGRTSVETAMLSRCTKEEILDLFDQCNSWDVIESGMTEGKGIILVTGHLGNWELTGAYMAARGAPMEAITRQQENPLFDSYITRTRERFGMKVIHDADAVRRVPRALRRGTPVAIVIDQGAAGLASTWVPFFGRWAKTPRGAATFAARLGSPIVFITALRKPDGRFNIHFEPVPFRLTGKKDDDVDRIMADCTAVLERWVRRYPEQYFWHHRRWKHQRPGTPPELGNPLA